MRNCGGLKTKGLNKKSATKMPLVSIITPVLNSKRYLEQTIKSVLGQSYANIEYIIIDGGSKDGSFELIKKYDDKLDYWTSESDSGMYDAVNKGLRIASGDILAHLNSDDLYSPETVSVAVNYFEQHADTELIYGNCDFIGPNGEFLYSYRYPEFRWKYFISMNFSSIPQPTTFWRKIVHEKAGYFDPTLKMCSDFDFYAKTGKYCRIEHVNKTLATFRIHDASLTALHGTINKNEVGIIHKRYIKSGKIQQWLLSVCLKLHLKLLNLPAMFRKTCFYLRKISRE